MPSNMMDENKQYLMAKALQSSGNFSILDCLAIACCIQHVIDNCLDDEKFISTCGTAVVEAIEEFIKPE